MKIDEQERKLVGSALHLKKKLKAIDELPHNGIMADMIKLTHKRGNKHPRDGSIGTTAMSNTDAKGLTSFNEIQKLPSESSPRFFMQDS